MILSFEGYFDLLLEPNMRFILEMYSSVSKSKVCDNLIGPINHEHRESGVVFPASHLFNILVQILADPLIRFPVLPYCYK